MANQNQDASREAIRKRLLAALEPALQSSQAAPGASREALRDDLTRQLAQGGPAVPPDPLQAGISPKAKVVPWQEVLQGPKKEASGLGFRGGEMLSNVPSSFYKQAKAVLWDLPLQAGANLIDYAKDPKKYLNDVAITGKYLPDIARIIKGDYEDFYSPDTFGENVTEDPMRPVADLAGLASVAGGGTAVTGKAAASALRGASRGAAKVAAGVGRVGRAVSKLERLDPSELVLRGVTAGMKPLANKIGLGQYTSRLKLIDATLGGEADAEEYQVAERIFAGKLTPAEHDAIIESFAVGNKEKNAQFAAQNPALWAKREKIAEWLTEDSKYHLEQEGFVDPGNARNAEATAWLRYKASKGEKFINPDGTTRDLALADAFEAIKEGGPDRPTFFRIFGEKDRGFFDAFAEKRMNGGIMSRAEQRAMKGELPKDIHQILSHQLRTSIGTQKNVKLARAAQEMLARDGQLKVVTNKTTPQEVKALKKAGYAPFEGPFYQKYHATLGKAVNMIADAAKQPGDMIQNVASGAERAKAVLLAAEEAMQNAPTELWAPAHAVNWLNLRLNPGDSLLGSVIRWGLNMGGTLPYYKAIATVLNPRYWIANAVGDAALSLLYGIHPQALKYAHKLKDMVPLEIRNIGINKLYQTDYNMFMRAANRLQNYAQSIDNFFKRAVWINEQVKIGVEKKLLKVGRDFFVAEDQMIPFIRHMAAAPNAWVDNLEAITKANEALAKTGMARAEIDKQRQTLNKRNARTSVQDGTKGKVAVDPVYGGAKHEAELYPDSKVSRPEKNVPTMADDIYGEGKAVPESAEKASLESRYKEIKANMKAVMNDATPGNDLARFEAIDRMAQELAQLGREMKQAAKPAVAAAGAADELAKVDPFSGDFSLGTPAEGKAVGPYDYQAGAEAQRLSPTQDRLRVIARQLDDNQMAKEQAFADMLWRVNELDQLRAVSPKLAAESQMADKAIEATARFFGSYNRLHPWEKKVVRQFIPFYTFTKAMTQLAFRLPFMMPKRQMVYLNLWRTWNDVIDNDGPQNSFYRSVVPVAALENGDIIAIKVNSLNPFGGLRSTGVAGFEIPSAFDLLGNHPVLRLAMSRGQVTAKPLQPGVMGTRLDNGEVWRYTADGFKRTLLQPSWAKSLWSMFPQGQLLDTLLPGAQEEGGFLLNPKTITGPDGQPLYPIGWPERLITAIVPATRLNPEKMMQRDMAKLLQIRRSYMKELRSSSPAKREVILTILREMSGDIRKRYLEY